MNKKFRKKKAFYVGVISIILCLSMFVSTTMAWFSDTVAIEGNRIEVGDVRVRLHMYNEDTGKYEDITGKEGDVFNTSGRGNGQQWEPSKTEIIFLKAVNTGSMSLAYNLFLNGTVEETEAEWEAKKEGVENLDEETLANLQEELSEELAKKFSNQPGLEYAIIPHMDYTAYQAMMTQAKQEKANVSIWDVLEENAGEECIGNVILNESTYIPLGEMNNKEKENYMVLAVRMNPYAGNDFQGRVINVDVDLTAKQLSHEFDSHGNLYDQDALFEGQLAERNLLKNGDLEQGSVGYSKYGNISAFGQNIIISSYSSGRRMPKPDDNPENDTYFKVYASENENITFTQAVSVVGGETYTLGGNYYLKQGKDSKYEDRFHLRVYFVDADGNTLSTKTGSNPKVYNEWQTMERVYTAPEDAVKMSIQFRAGSGKGIIYLDNLSLYGKAPEVAKKEAPVYPYYEGIEGAVNLFTNPGFEELIEEQSDPDYGFPVGWGRYNKAANPNAAHVTNEYDDTVTVNDTYDGEHSVYVSGAGNPYYSQRVRVEPNTTYQISMWTKVKNHGSGSNVGTIKLEFYDDNKYESSLVYMSEYCGHTERYSYDDWFRYSYQFTTPGGCDYVQVYLRAKSAAYPVYFDNAEFIQLEKTSALDVRTNEIFYYEEWGNAIVTATATYEADKDKFVKFYLMDGTNALIDSEPISLNGKVTEYKLQEGVATWEFDISLMKDYMKEYTLKAVLCDADGNEVASDNARTMATTTSIVEKEVYRSARPKNMNVDENGVPTGTYTVQRWDGTVDDEFVPIIAYHAYDRLDEYAELGINTIQNNAMTSAEAAVSRVNGRLEKYGQYSLVQLYLNMCPAGSRCNIETTIEVVEAVKDLPGTLGYMIMDEPDDQTCDEEAMKESYRIIRSLDDKHPVYTLSIDDFDWSEKYVDIIANDPYASGAPYPATNNQGHVRSDFSLVSQVYNRTIPGVVEANNEGERKLFYAVVLAFTSGDFVPSYDQMRTQIYSVLFAGVDGYGFFAMDQNVTLEDGTKVRNMDHPMFAAHKEMTASGEKEILLDYFVRNHGELFMEDLALEPDGTIISSSNHVFAEGETDFSFGNLIAWDHGEAKCRYVIWKEADSKGRLTGNLYAALMDGNALADHISIPLDNGTESIGEFTATVVSRLENGEKVPSFTGNGTLEFDLDNQQSVLIKIVPKK